MSDEVKHTNGAGLHPAISHPSYETQRAVNGSSNNKTDVHFVGTDKPLMVAAAIGLAGIAMWMAYTNHESDQAALREFSDWSAKTYNREVAIDADMQLLGINTRAKFGEIPVPPAAKLKKKE
jgi:hypothetical protein